MPTEPNLSAVPGFRVGSAEDPVTATGCTVVLCPPDGAVGGVDQRGGAPGTRETDCLRPLHLVERCHAVLLTGGSAFGLEAAGGVVRYLEERGIGFDAGVARVPIVPAAVLFDLAVGRADARPDPAMALAACREAELGGPVRMGNAGAGCGASVGKILGMIQAMKSGQGSTAIEAIPGVWVGALVVVNAFGDLCDPETGRIVAGARSLAAGPEAGGTPGVPLFADTVAVLRNRGGASLSFGSGPPGAARPDRGGGRLEAGTARSAPEDPLTPGPGLNTVLSVVAVNARLDKEETNVLASMASAGLARVIRPAQTTLDGDTLIALAAGERACDVNVLGAVAADLVARAALLGALRATNLHGLPAATSGEGR